MPPTFECSHCSLGPRQPSYIRWIICTVYTVLSVFLKWPSNYIYNTDEQISLDIPISTFRHLFINWHANYTIITTAGMLSTELAYFYKIYTWIICTCFFFFNYQIHVYIQTCCIYKNYINVVWRFSKFETRYRNANYNIF